MSHVLDEDLIYEVLSAVEEIPEGKVASYGQIARLIGREECKTGRADSFPRRILWKLPVSSGGESCRTHGPGLAAAAGAAGSRRCYIS